MFAFTEEFKRSFEAMPVPLAYFQRTEGRIQAILVSDGLCEMMNAPRDALIGMLNDGLFDRVHPDDAGRLARVVREFGQHLCEYDVIYRGRYKPDGEYHYIHSIGRFQPTDDGTELALFVYTDVSESQSESRLLVENYELFQKDHFYSDPVTGLPNMNFLVEFAEKKLAGLRAGRANPALIYFDVNGLRSYNNQYGPDKGDELLCLIADVLKSDFPEGLVVRGAEDHFVVITPDGPDLPGVIDDVNAKVRAGALGNTSGVHAGIYAFERDVPLPVALDNARHALKQIGSDLNLTHLYYTRETDDAYWNQRYILENFDAALKNGWIKIYYQAIVRVRTGKYAALEALARWVDPSRGIIPPAEFIPVLEKYHLLYKLDLFMAEQLLREIPERQAIGLPILPVSVNFSAQDFDHADVVGSLDALFERYGANKDNIIIEITEQDLARATDRFKRQLRALRDGGYRVWIDDFGSGYSSLNVFYQYRVDVTKFDLEFLRHLDDNRGVNRHIMRAMTEVSRKLGVRTLAEGVETKEQLAFLKEIGCEFAQGFYLHRPECLDVIRYKFDKNVPMIPCETPEERLRLHLEWKEGLG